MTQHDQLHRYLFENYAVRGELVTVSETLEQILANHTYPQPVKTVLAELLVATSLLTATLKFAITSSSCAASRACKARLRTMRI